MDDIRNDIVRIEPFFAIARRVVDLDRRREASMQHIPDLTPDGTSQRAGAHRRKQLDHRLGGAFADASAAPAIGSRSSTWWSPNRSPLPPMWIAR